MIRKDSLGPAAAVTAIANPVVTGEGMVILDESLTIVASDSGAELLLKDINDEAASSESQDKLPSKLFSLMDARSHHEWHGVSLTVKIGEDEYSCRAFLVEPRFRGGVQKMIALHLKRELSIADAVHQIGQDYHLTDREQQALIGVSMGLTSKELATRMKISPNTVKAFVRLIMIKMGVTTRAGIVGKLLDQNNRHTQDT